MTDLDFLRRAGRILADRGPTARVGTIDILALEGRCVLWPDSATDAGDPAIQIVEGGVETAIERARAVTHTPGPWQSVATKHRTLINSIEGYRVAECDSLSEADAALIAAAPELLAALREARYMVFHMTSDLPSSRPWNALLPRLDAAIAKATGA